MLKKLGLTNRLISSVGLGIILLAGISADSEGMIIISNRGDDDVKSNVMAELSLTAINYDYYTDVASNLDLNLLGFSPQQRRELAQNLNPTLNPNQSIASAPLQIVDAAKLLLSNGNINNQLEARYTSYMASNIEVVSSSNSTNEPKIAFLPKTEANDIYDNVYEFEIAMNQKEYTLSSGIGEMLSTNSNSLNSQEEQKATYHGLQKQLVDSLSESSKERAKIMAQGGAVPAPTTAPTIAQIAGGNTGWNRSVSRGSNWFQFFGMGQMQSNASGLLGTEESDYVRQQLILQQASRASVQNKTQGLARPVGGYNFRY